MTHQASCGCRRRSYANTADTSISRQPPAFYEHLKLAVIAQPPCRCSNSKARQSLPSLYPEWVLQGACLYATAHPCQPARFAS